MRSESEIQAEARIKLSALPGVTVWRNNVGKLPDANGRWVEFGLCKGSSDLIGLRSVLITPDMVGTVIAQFVAVECKTAKGRERDEQVRFREFCSRAGALALVFRGPEDIKKL